MTPAHWLTLPIALVAVILIWRTTRWSSVFWPFISEDERNPMNEEKEPEEIA